MNTNIIRTANHGVFDRITAFFGNLNESRRRYSTYRQTVRELESLSERELLDLGLHRSMIENIALEAAYGK